MSNTVKISMLPKEYQDIARVIGVKTFMKLCRHFGGVNITVPQTRYLTQHIRNTRIKRDFTGKNLKTLSRRYDLNEQQIRKIVEAPINHLQTTIYDFTEQR